MEENWGKSFSGRKTTESGFFIFTAMGITSPGPRPLHAPSELIGAESSGFTGEAGVGVGEVVN